MPGARQVNGRKYEQLAPGQLHQHAMQAVLWDNAQA